MPKKVHIEPDEGFFSCPQHPMLIVPTINQHNTGLHGGSFFGKLGKSLKKDFRHVAHIVAPIAKSGFNDVKSTAQTIGNKALNEAKSSAQSIGNNIVSQGKQALKSAALKQIGAYAPMAAEGAMVAAGKPKRKRAVSAKMAKRHALVRKLMHEKGMSLPTASAYIKQHNLV